jgi:hypothetical protein
MNLPVFLCDLCGRCLFSGMSFFIMKKKRVGRAYPFTRHIKRSCRNYFAGMGAGAGAGADCMGGARGTAGAVWAGG